MPSGMEPTDTPSTMYDALAIDSDWLSTSEAPVRRSRLKVAEPSEAELVRGAATTGASFVPVIVTVAVCATEPPLPSETV